MMGLLFESVVKISLVLAAALIGTGLLRRRSSAAVRHWILAAAVVVAAAMPLLQIVAPEWGLPLSASWLASESASPLAAPVVPAAETTVRVGAAASTVRVSQRAVERRSWRSILSAIWIAGSAVMLALLIVGLARLVVLTRRAAPIRDGEWQYALSDMLRRAAVWRTVAVRESAIPGVLVAWGAVRPEIILPAASRSWPASRVRIVLAHELAHITRHDWPLQIVAELVRAACWFNPLVWVVVGRLRSESERACDDAVMRGGVDGTDYAAELLGIATELRGGRPGWLPAPAMARASHLEGRVAAMLNPQLDRRPLSPARRAISLAIALALALGLSGYAISAQTFSTFAGSISDQLGGLIPNATLVLVNKASGNKYEVKSNSVGSFEFVGLPSGEYSLESYVPGFKSAQTTLVIGGQSIRRDLALEVGSLQETISVTASRSMAQQAADRKLPMTPYRSAADLRERRTASPQADCTAPVSGGIGGNIKAPTKIANARPFYPDVAALANIEGLVELAVVIGPDGTITSANVEGDANPDLARQAVDAVSQWEYTPTLLNCVAVSVPMKVLVRFGLEP